MVLHRPAGLPDLCFLIKEYLHSRKMKLSKQQEKEYVSCIKYKGIPIPPPVMTEERRQQCRIWRKEAMLVEKELELKRKEKELEKLKASYESSLSSHSRQSSNFDSGAFSLPIIELLRDAVYQRSTKNFHALLREITQELHKFVTGSEVVFPDLKEFKFLLIELRKEILKRQSLHSQVPQYVKNSDSTYNDVAHVTFNQLSDSPNSFDTIREVSQFPLDRKSDSNSLKTYNDISLHSESTFKLLDECTPDDDSLSLANSLPADGSRCSFLESRPFTSSPRCEADIFIPKEPDIKQMNSITLDQSVLSTPTKAIRRNSYTLESPSPSVLAYLRNLTLECSKDKTIITSNCDRTGELNSSKSVVRNLNDVWDKENVSNKYMDDVSPYFRDSLEDIDDVRCLLNDENQNLECSEKNSNSNDLLASYHEHQLAQNMKENDKILKQTKAAVVIQSYVRGYFVRRLMRTYKVEQIKNTIKDALVCAWNLYEDQIVTPSDLHLHKRIVQQVTAACYELHSIFFKWSTSEKMALISADRERQKNPKSKRMSREMRKSESDSASTRLNPTRPPSRTRTRSQTPVFSHKRTKSNETDIKRPSTLPSTPRSLSLNYKPWR